MTVEQLLQPRIKLKAPYPYCPWEVDEILVKSDSDEWISLTGGYCESHKKIVGDEIYKYPHIFKPLQWHEDRLQKDMPEYVRRISDNAVFKLKSGQYVLTLIEKIGVGTYEFEYIVTAFLPATEAEYLYYINSKKCP